MMVFFSAVVVRRPADSEHDEGVEPSQLWHALQQCWIAWACSAAVPHVFLYSLVPERWHFDSAVAALLLDFAHVPHVAAIPMVLEQSPVRRAYSLESDKVLAPVLCQPPPFAHVGLRSPQLGPLCLLRFREARDAAPGAC